MPMIDTVSTGKEVRLRKAATMPKTNPRIVAEHKESNNSPMLLI